MANKKGAAAAEAVIDAQTGIDLAKVKAEVVDRYLGIFVPGSVAGTATARLHRLASFFESRAPAAGKEPDADHPLVGSKCDVCQGMSDIRLACCPYCGDAETDGETNEEAGLRALGGALAVDAAKGVQLSDARQVRKRRGAKGSEPAQGELPIASDASPGPGTEDASTGQGDAAAEAPSPSGEMVVEPKTDLLPAEVEDTKATVEDLDLAVAKVHAKIGEGYASAYDIGQALSDIYSRKLWLQRRMATSGKVAHKSWSDFMKSEVPAISYGYSYTLMSVCTKYSREQFAEIGPSKLSWALRAPEGMETEVLESARTETLGGLKQRVLEMHGGTLPTRDTGRTGMRSGGAGGSKPDAGKGPAAGPGRPKGSKNKTTKTPAAEPARPAPKHDKGKTVALTVGKLNVPLFKRTNEEARAKRLVDDPIGEETLANGMRITYRIRTSPKGELYLAREVLEA